MKRGRGCGIIQARILIGDQHGDGRADGFAHAYAGEEFGFVGFDFLSSAAAVTALAAEEFLVDQFLVDGHAGGHPFDETDEGFAVRFAGRAIGKSRHDALFRS